MDITFNGRNIWSFLFDCLRQIDKIDDIIALCETALANKQQSDPSFALHYRVGYDQCIACYAITIIEHFDDIDQGTADIDLIKQKLKSHCCNRHAKNVIHLINKSRISKGLEPYDALCLIHNSSATTGSVDSSSLNEQLDGNDSDNGENQFECWILKSPNYEFPAEVFGKACSLHVRKAPLSHTDEDDDGEFDDEHNAPLSIMPVQRNVRVESLQSCFRDNNDILPVDLEYGGHLLSTKNGEWKTYDIAAEDALAKPTIPKKKKKKHSTNVRQFDPNDDDECTQKSRLQLQFGMARAIFPESFSPTSTSSSSVNNDSMSVKMFEEIGKTLSNISAGKNLIVPMKLPINPSPHSSRFMPMHEQTPRDFGLQLVCTCQAHIGCVKCRPHASAMTKYWVGDPAGYAVSSSPLDYNSNAASASGMMVHSFTRFLWSLKSTVNIRRDEGSVLAKDRMTLYNFQMRQLIYSHEGSAGDVFPLLIQMCMSMYEGGVSQMSDEMMDKLSPELFRGSPNDHRKLAFELPNVFANNEQAMKDWLENYAMGSTFERVRWMEERKKEEEEEEDERRSQYMKRNKTTSHSNKQRQSPFKSLARASDTQLCAMGAIATMSSIRSQMGSFKFEATSHEEETGEFNNVSLGVQNQIESLMQRVEELKEALGKFSKADRSTSPLYRSKKAEKAHLQKLVRDMRSTVDHNGQLMFITNLERSAIEAEKKYHSRDTFGWIIDETFGHKRIELMNMIESTAFLHAESEDESYSSLSSFLLPIPGWVCEGGMTHFATWLIIQQWRWVTRHEKLHGNSAVASSSSPSNFCTGMTILDRFIEWTRHGGTRQTEYHRVESLAVDLAEQEYSSDDSQDKRLPHQAKVNKKQKGDGVSDDDIMEKIPRLRDLNKETEKSVRYILQQKRQLRDLVRDWNSNSVAKGNDKKASKDGQTRAGQGGLFSFMSSFFTSSSSTSGDSCQQEQNRSIFDGECSQWSIAEKRWMIEYIQMSWKLFASLVGGAQMDG